MTASLKSFYAGVFCARGSIKELVRSGSKSKALCVRLTASRDIFGPLEEWIELKPAHRKDDTQDSREMRIFSKKAVKLLQSLIPYIQDAALKNQAVRMVEKYSNLLTQ